MSVSWNWNIYLQSALVLPAAVVLFCLILFCFRAKRLIYSSQCGKLRNKLSVANGGDLRERKVGEGNFQQLKGQINLITFWGSCNCFRKNSILYSKWILMTLLELFDPWFWKVCLIYRSEFKQVRNLLISMLSILCCLLFRAEKLQYN